VAVQITVLLLILVVARK